MSYSAILINTFKNHGIVTDSIQQNPENGLVRARLRLGSLPRLHVEFPSDYLGVTILNPAGSTDFTFGSPDDPSDVAREVIEHLTTA